MSAQEPSVDTTQEGAADPALDEEIFEPEPLLPEPVRQRVITLAAAALTGLPIDELPSPLRRVAKFAPNRRARLGGPMIALQLSGDPLLRQRLPPRGGKKGGGLWARPSGRARCRRRRPRSRWRRWRISPAPRAGARSSPTPRRPCAPRPRAP